MNRNANRNFAFGLVIRLTQRDAAFGGHRRPQHDPDHQDDHGRRDPERDGLLEGDQEELHARDASRWAVAAANVAVSLPGLAHPRRRRDPLRPTWPIRRAPGLVGRRRVGASAARGAPVRAAGARAQLSAGGFILDDLESARAKAPPRDGARPAAVGARHRLQQPDAPGRRRRRSRPPRPRPIARHRRRAPHVARVVPHTLSPAPGLGRRPHRLRRRLPRPAAGRLARGAADPARAAARRAAGSTSRWPAGRRSTATSRPCPRPTSGGAS